MKDLINQYLQECDSLTVSTKDELEQVRIKFMGKKGILNDLFAQFKQVPNEDKKEVGMLLNQLKTSIQDKIHSLANSFTEGKKSSTNEDYTKPSSAYSLGNRHPLSIIRREMVNIFARLGYTIVEGPEIEDDHHVFSALNFPPEHPARDMQDTFFIRSCENTENNIVLRTHTSSVQVRTMEIQKPPIRIIAPGRVFRNEAISARAHCIFHQMEGLYIDKGVSFADLKQTLLYFSKEMFGSNTQIRLRPSYFPFTEPSAEMDVSCNLCGGSGCNVCKGTGWLEIMGCGMVDPNVLKASGIDPEIYSGFAFGMGLERIAMLKYGVNDIRMYFENNVRFLSQFESAW